VNTGVGARASRQALVVGLHAAASGTPPFPFLGRHTHPRTAAPWPLQTSLPPPPASCPALTLGSRAPARAYSSSTWSRGSAVLSSSRPTSLRSRPSSPRSSLGMGLPSSSAWRGGGGGAGASRGQGRGGGVRNEGSAHGAAPAACGCCPTANPTTTAFPKPHAPFHNDPITTAPVQPEQDSPRPPTAPPRLADLALPLICRLLLALEGLPVEVLLAQPRVAPDHGARSRGAPLRRGALGRRRLRPAAGARGGRGLRAAPAAACVALAGRGGQRGRRGRRGGAAARGGRGGRRRPSAARGPAAPRRPVAAPGARPLARRAHRGRGGAVRCGARAAEWGGGQRRALGVGKQARFEVLSSARASQAPRG
jgi:hypothetical protein